MNKKYVDLNEILLALPKSAAKIIEDWPAANVREVKRGKWVDSLISADNLYDRLGMMSCIRGYVCDNCKEFSIARYNFCPNCGADMRGNDG